jgi:uncharacterized membrane protein YsdA (DUF1294 family)
MKKTLWIYTLLSVALSVSLATSFQSRLTNVHPYVTWIAGWSIVTWAIYAWDKRTAELGKLLKGWRVPEVTLHLLALMGGFTGAWIARSMFRHKINSKRHPVILAILIASTILHLLIMLRLLIGPPLELWPPSRWLT